MDDKGNAPLLETIDLKKYFKVGGGTLHAVDSINIKPMFSYCLIEGRQTARLFCRNALRSFAAAPQS